MWQRILKKLTYNLGFKILALALAFTLWLVVYNIEDPDKTTYYTIAVSIQNPDAVADMNKCYEVTGNANVTISVTAKRSILEKLDEADFSAVADMEDLVVSDDGTTGSVPISLTCSRYGASVKLGSRTRSMEVTLEDMLSKQFVITAETTGSVASGYALGEVTIENPNVLKVTGPESIVTRINSVVATIDVDGMSQDISDNVIPVLYDQSGNVLDSPKLTMSNNTVTIKAEILGTKEVPLKFTTSGTPAGDNCVIGIESDPEEVLIKGQTAVLNEISYITIPDTVLNVDDADEDLETDINITDYLPEGTSLVNTNQASVHVTVEIQVFRMQNITLSTSALQVKGLNSAYVLSYDISTVTVEVEGTEENLDLLSDTSIRGSIDVNGLTAGKHKVAVTLNLDSSHYTYRTAYVEITIADK